MARHEPIAIHERDIDGEARRTGQVDDDVAIGVDDMQVTVPVGGDLPTLFPIDSGDVLSGAQDSGTVDDRPAMTEPWSPAAPSSCQDGSSSSCSS